MSIFFFYLFLIFPSLLSFFYIYSFFSFTRVIVPYIQFPSQAPLTAVELDSAMVEVAQRWFGFAPDNRMRVEVCDGLDYVEKAAEEGEAEGVEREAKFCKWIGGNG